MRRARRTISCRTGAIRRFWDPANWQSLSDRCHKTIKPALEQAFLARPFGVQPAELGRIFVEHFATWSFGKDPLARRILLARPADVNEPDERRDLAVPAKRSWPVIPRACSIPRVAFERTKTSVRL